MSKIITCLMAGAALTACISGGAVPADKLSRAASAVRSAQDMGAERDPIAATYLASARDQLAAGRKLVVYGESDRARFVLMRAEADAVAATDLARESSAKAQAQKAKEDVQKLRASIQEGSNQ